MPLSQQQILEQRTQQSNQGLFPSTKPTFTNAGMGGMKQVGLTGMPSMAQWHAGLINDYNLQNTLNQTNFNRKQNAADMFLSMGQSAMQNFQDPKKNGQLFFDQAQDFASQGYKDATAQQAKIDKQLKDAAGKQAQGHAAAKGMYDKAIANMSPEAAAARYKQAEQEAESRLKADTERVPLPEKVIPTRLDDSANKIASAMNAAAARKAENDYSQNYGQYDGGVGTESQFQEIANANRRNVENSIFQATSQLQGQQGQFNASQEAATNQFNAGRLDQNNQINAAQTNRNNEAIYNTHMGGAQYDFNVRSMQSQLMAGKGNLIGQLADSAAGFAATSANISMATAQAKGEFSKLGAQISMANASFQFQNNDAFMNAAMNVGKGYYDMISMNPVMGVAVMPTLMAMGELSKQYGYDGNTYMHPSNQIGTPDNFGQPTSSDWALQRRNNEMNNQQYAREMGFNYV